MENKFFRIDDIIKKVKGRSKKETLYPIFTKCATLTSDTFWKSFFEDLACGKYPKNIYIDNGNIKSSGKKTWLSYNFENETPQDIIDNLCPLLIDKGNVCSKIDKKQKKISLEKSQKNKTNDYKTWSSIRKKAAKEVYIGKFVESEQKKKKLTTIEAAKLLDIISLGILVKTINNSDIIIDNGKITEIKSLKYDSEKREYTIDREIPYNLHLDKIIDINGSCCALIWNKAVKDYSKSLKTMLK